MYLYPIELFISHLCPTCFKKHESPLEGDKRERAREIEREREGERDREREKEVCERVLCLDFDEPKLIQAFDTQNQNVSDE